MSTENRIRPGNRTAGSSAASRAPLLPRLGQPPPRRAVVHVSSADRSAASAAAAACSSTACASSPGTREMMNSPLPSSGSNPRSPQTAAIAPSTLSGSGLLARARASRSARARRRAAAGSARRRARARAPAAAAARRADRACGCGGRSPAGLGPLRSALSSERVARPSSYDMPCLAQREALLEEPHAGLDVAAVVACRSRGRRPRRASRSGAPDVVPRSARPASTAASRRGRSTTRSTAANSLPIDGRRQLAAQQQVDRLGERQPAHQLVDGVAADLDLVRRDPRDGRWPSGAVPASRRAGCRGVAACRRAIVRCHRRLSRTVGHRSDACASTLGAGARVAGQRRNRS